jgi:hypothetical protein
VEEVLVVLKAAISSLIWEDIQAQCFTGDEQLYFQVLYFSKYDLTWKTVTQIIPNLQGCLKMK